MIPSLYYLNYNVDAILVDHKQVVLRWLDESRLSAINRVLLVCLCGADTYPSLDWL